MNKSENGNKIEYLPKKLIAELNLDIFTSTGDYRTNNNFLKCVGIIYNKQVTKSIGIRDYLPLGSKYWKKIFGGDYHSKVLKPLLEQDIIQSHDFGYRNITHKKGLVGIRYRINPELIEGDCEVIDYNCKGKVITSEELEFNNGQEFEEIKITNKKFSISILTDKAREYVQTHAEGICKSQLNPEFVDNFPSSYVITYHEYADGSFNTKYGKVDSVKIHAQIMGKQLFYYNQALYVADTQEFLRSRIESTTYHYLMEISKVGKIPLLHKRSLTNLRLHNYLTNFPSRLLHFLKLNNQGLVQYDLQTSQFLLFANILNTYLCHGEEFLLKLFKHRLNQQYLKRLIKILRQYKLRLPSCGVDISNPHSCLNSGHDVLDFIRDVFCL